MSSPEPQPDVYEFHVISQTHWDREWRLPFQQTRIMLVDMLDHLIDLLETCPEYRHYHLDGQTILLEDYLDLRPENRRRLFALISAGRILVGPWYTLPEENLVDGECLVRNLLEGHALARELGGVMKVGFTPTSYGQISQMPQIYMGFGIDSIFFHRGVPAHEVRLEYLWQGADGTKIIGFRPPVGGRFNFSTVVMNPLLAAGNGDAAPYSPASARDLHRSSSIKTEDDAAEDGIYYSTAIPTQWDERTLKAVLGDLRRLTAEEATTPHLMCGEGHDLMEANPVLPEVIAAANRLGGPDRFSISSLPQYVARIRESAERLQTVTGEMRSTQKDPRGARLYSSTLSSRMYLKQANRRVEALLLKWAEPFSALLWTLGDDYPQTSLRKAWRFLLANHAHDSISGTGTDQVHDDMKWRFDQAELIAQELTRKALIRLSDLVDVEHAREGEALVTVFNPLPYNRDEVVEFDLDLPEEADGHYRIVDPAGREVAFQELGSTPRIHTVQQTHGFPYRFYATQRRVCLAAADVPACGYKTYRVERLSAKSPTGRTGEPVEDPVRVSGDRQMENRHLKVHINLNGTLNVLHKGSGRWHRQLSGFEDCGEIGDSYEHTPPTRDTVVTSAETVAAVSLLTDHPLAASFRVDVTLDLPTSVAADKQTREEEHKPVRISSTITLRSGARRVDIITRVDNQVRDHRLRALFPSGIETDACQAESQFDLVTRSTVRAGHDGWIEPPRHTQPQLNFVDLSDGDRGLAIINRGLPEYEVLDDPARTVALTLLRCFTHKIRATQADDPSQAGTQCPGVHEFRYAIYPHDGDAVAGGVLTEAYRHNHGLRIVQSWKHAEPDPSSRRLPTSMAGLSLTPNSLVLSCIKRSENGQRLVVRLFNPTAQPVEGRLSTHCEISEAATLDLEENAVDTCPVREGGEIALVVAPKRIVTLGLSLERPSP